MTYKDFTQMSVWKQAFRLILLIYKVTKTYPKEEKFGLISDMRRAANSVAHNIAEGYGRFEPRDKTRFYKISRGSCYELISQTLVSNKLNFLNNELDKENILKLCKSIINELDSLIYTLEHRKNS